MSLIFCDVEAQLADWAEHQDLAPHKGCRCDYCIVLAELANLKESFARLREDRDMHSELRQEHFAEVRKFFAEKLELEKEVAYLKMRLEIS